MLMMTWENGAMFPELKVPLTSLAGSLRLVSDWEEQQQGYNRLWQHGQEVLHAICRCEGAVPDDAASVGTSDGHGMIIIEHQCLSASQEK
jgi:hypothetical protein